MLVACTEDGKRIVASRQMRRGATIFCPMCGSRVLPKPGRVVIAHFAHVPGSACAWAGETEAHLQAKLMLAEMYQEAGWRTETEAAFPAHGRRIDLLVTHQLRPQHRMAIEVQNSPISADTVQVREHIDQDLGMTHTQWVNVGDRAEPILNTPLQAEVRVPADLAARDVGQPLLRMVLLDGAHRQLFVALFRAVLRERMMPDGTMRRDRLKCTRRLVKLTPASVSSL